jgi:transposase
MSRRLRRNHTPAFKAKVALAAIKGDRTVVQLAEQFDVHPNQVTSWKAQLEGGAADVFGPGSGGGTAEPAVDVKSLHAKIGELTLENDFLEGALTKDQGGQFTGVAFTGALTNNGIAISMDGKAPGETTCSSSGYGAASNTRRCICGPMTASARPALRLVATWTSITAGDRIRALTARHPIKPTSPRCPSAWQPNPGRGSTYRRGNSVQTTGTTLQIGGRNGADAEDFVRRTIKNAPTPPRSRRFA